jgi:hypothetical protein
VDENMRGFAAHGHDLDILKGQILANADSESLGTGFFRGPACGQRFLGSSPAQAVGPFLFGKDPFEKTVVIHHLADAVHFDEVNTQRG